MVVISSGVPALSPDIVSLYYTTDKLLGNLPVLIFHGPSTTVNSTLNSSRIQAHVYTLAGFQSFPRLTIAPTSPLYGAVNHLPNDQQGDEICRGLAIGLFKYLAELPNLVKTALVELAGYGRSEGTVPAMFNEKHAGDLAARMTKVANVGEIVSILTAALSESVVSWVDVDVMLPPNSFVHTPCPSDCEDKILHDDSGTYLRRFGDFAPLVKLFGSLTFLPTSKIRRAPSRPTPLSRSRSLLKGHKECLRREMCEMLDTEERYVGKLYDLVHSVAVEFRLNAEIKPYSTTSPSERAMERLFPKCLNDVLEINTAFLAAIRTTLNETENAAIDDIRSSQAEFIHAVASNDSELDATGTHAFAQALVDWFPRFIEPYQDYLRSSVEFPMILNEFLRDSASRFSRQVNETGEQRLRSMLIEPVQRLPRYSLFIDNMANLLPARHPALANLLRAKDMITTICSLDNDTDVDASRSIDRLKQMISGWPPSLAPRGRLVTVVDATELSPPYTNSQNTEQGQASLLLLFTETLIVVRKMEDNRISARGILAEVDRPGRTFDRSDGSTQEQTQTLSYSSCFTLHSLRFSESQDGMLIWMTCTGQVSYESFLRKDSCSGNYPFVKVFSLLGSYEGKAARWSEEVARARIEGRFAEDFRESNRWALHTTNAPNNSLGILAAVFESNGDGAEKSIRGHGRVRVAVTNGREPGFQHRASRGTAIRCHIAMLGRNQYRLDFDGFDDDGFTDHITEKDFLAVFSKRLGSLLRVQNQIRNPLLTNAFISCHQKILQALPIHWEAEELSRTTNRPISPVKLIANFLGSVSTRDDRSQFKSWTAPSMYGIPSLPPPSLLPIRSNSQNTSSEISSASKVTLKGVNIISEHNAPLASLEETFSTYVVALRSRSGNVVGRVLRGRAGADELLVNELYNSLLEDPSNVQATAEVSIDVLFVAFEKFLNKAWTTSMGPLLAPKTLKKMQSNSDLMKPIEFQEHFKSLLVEMTPQNKRAFATLLKLLSELLDASGNDGDRGALIATFAESLVIEGNPHDHITLLDRLIDDYDRLFDETSASTLVSDASASNSKNNSFRRTRSSNTGSINSNTSSLRKRLGFGMASRENSKSESESKVALVWRTISKNNRSIGDGESQAVTTSKASVARSKSTDTDPRITSSSRPLSRDRPIVLGTINQEESQYRPGSGHKNQSSLSTIGDAHPKTPTVLLKKKRRSSLSDLKAVQLSSIPLTWDGPSPHEPAIAQRSLQDIKLPSRTASLRTPSPNKQGSQIIAPSTNRFESLPRKGSSSPVPPNTLTDRPINRSSGEVVITKLSPKKGQNPTSATITTKGRLEGPSTQSPDPSPKKATLSPQRPLVAPQKLRMQSPQKLRQRLKNEQKTIKHAETSLQAELARIGDEMSALRLDPPNHSASTRMLSHTKNDKLTTQMTALHSKYSTAIADLTVRSTQIEADLESSMTVHENKARKLEELYREANIENEALYERFNDELSKVLEAVKAGQGVQELKTQLKTAQDEVARLKRENARLKRENVGLRSQMRGE